MQIIGNGARVDPTTRIGPFTIIEDGVEIGPENIIGPNVIIKKGTILGRGNVISAGAQLGVEPQDYHFQGEPSCCIIGDNNIIREYATISRATGKGEKTLIGDNNFIMTYVHIAHNIRMGSNITIASGTQIGGYVEIDDFATIGGLAGIHQFCHIGKYAMLGAKSYLNRDLLPYLLASGNRACVYGINTKGLLLHNFDWTTIDEIKRLFKIIYHNSNPDIRMELLKNEKTVYATEFLNFIKGMKRGLCHLCPVYH
ncbi:acyl-[acyl-carrier-protein]--UDP-N-acetylglucosamine O-acyltransferase [candidate division WOR-3 bacterium 4484_100]|uniref:Acyl-[acyl-carrier-protein]--UDP-N-acetylglucosamine O-acyltransferase n=1 Tax=candidate division WOR-3 bacterium 4484_100 TaxID=1936077 RepID=A0A1V4QHN9_UNCW3|nr:MAG: acyl-[acyl-carrier-protein]--UDP-N-acetylglucosamine O-acyltransferase [candidate division WOR-3 bacterium 4484_100]